MSAPLPPMDNAASPQRKWLPWLIGLAVVVVLLFWMRGCGKEPATGVTADTTQTMIAPPAPAPVDTAPAPAPAKTSPSPAPKPSPSRAAARAADTVPAAAPGNDGVGAMGGHGASGKKAPTGQVPTPQAQQKP